MDTLFWGYHKHHLSVSYRNAQVDQLLSKRPKKPVQTQTHKIKQDFESPGIYIYLKKYDIYNIFLRF